MPTFDEYRVLPVADRLSRLRQAPGELDEAIADRDDAELGKRPDERNWSAKEILCHLRDVEELFQVRFHTIVALDEPSILVLGATPDDLAPWRIGGSIPHPLDADRWVEDRQYVRNDARLALAAFPRGRPDGPSLLVVPFLFKMEGRG